MSELAFEMTNPVGIFAFIVMIFLVMSYCALDSIYKSLICR